jgi:predicted nucleic acid-binding protein
MFQLILPRETIIDDTFAFLRKHKLSVWDAHMLATCAAHGCSVLFSEDLTDGERYGSISVVNPFNPANATRIAELLA